MHNGKLSCYVKIRCHCGSERWLYLTSTVYASNSCGCLLSQLVSEHKKKHGDAHKRLYTIWLLMKRRCYGPQYKEYVNYGGRGITICDDWLNSYEKFRDWAVSAGYSDELSIDRIDVNGSYHPDNCRWATPTQQGRNKRNTIYVTLNGITKPLREWCDEFGTNHARVDARRALGWSDADALLYEKNGRYKRQFDTNLVTYKGETLPLYEWCTRLRLDYARISKRYYRGWPPERMFEEPIIRRHIVGQ